MLKSKSIRAIICVFMAVLIVVLSLFTTVGVSSEDVIEENAVDKGLVLESQRPTGAMPDTRIAIPDSESTFLTYDMRSLPNAVDLSQSESFPPIGDQGSISSCVAWACAYYQFGYQVAAMNSWNVTNDTSKQFSPKWIYNMVNRGKDEGCSAEYVYWVLQTHGDVRFSECVPTGADTPSEYKSWYLDEDALEQALRYRVVSNEHLEFASTLIDTPVTSYNSNCLTNMKTLINNGHVLTINTEFRAWDYKQLTSQTKSELNGQYVCIKVEDKNNTDSSHQMAVVGYDDTVSYDLNGNGTIQNFEKGAFKIANSHGTGYKNDGFVWLMYDALNPVSNASSQNSENRLGAFINNAYDVIAVAEFSLDLVAKVTIGQRFRCCSKVDLGVSTIEGNVPANNVPTIVDHTQPYMMLNFLNYSGTGTDYEEATFVLDYGSLFNYCRERMKYYVSISDALLQNNSTTIKKIELVDSTGKIISVSNDTIELYDETRTFAYQIGLVGDVNNDGVVSTADATLIRKYCSDLAQLSDEDLVFADVNGDGNVTLNDATTIQKYIADLITEFENGKVSVFN